jgi:hypothetical protein
MNSKLEACVACDHQCIPEQQSEALVNKAKKQAMTAQQKREAISRISQNASQLKCPSSEIVRIRLTTFDQIDPIRSSHERASFRAFGVKDSAALPFYKSRSDRS